MVLGTEGLFDGRMPGSPSTSGPMLHDWCLQMSTVLLNLGLRNATHGEDDNASMQSMAAFALMQGMSQRMRTAIAKQPRLTSSGAAMWTYLKAVYAPQGIAGLLYCMALMKSAKPSTTDGTVHPDNVREYIEHCRSLWLLSSTQICNEVSWATKLEMLFRALDDEWCTQFKFALTERLQYRVASSNMQQQLTEMSAWEVNDAGNQLIEFAIAEILLFMAGRSAQMATRTTADEVHYTDARGGGARRSPGGKGGKGGDKGKARKWMTPPKGPARDAYFANETASQKETRLATRKGIQCNACKGYDHFSCDPECAGPNQVLITDTTDMFGYNDEDDWSE